MGQQQQQERHVEAQPQRQGWGQGQGQDQSIGRLAGYAARQLLLLCQFLWPVPVNSQRNEKNRCIDPALMISYSYIKFKTIYFNSTYLNLL